MLSTSLKRLFGMLVAGVTLSLVILAMLPEIAEAQDTASVYNTQTTNQNADVASAQSAPSDYRLVIYPGDTVWSVSQRWLGPDAPPPQVGGEVERILELNYDRLAGNPDLIFPGQELLLPPPEPTLSEAVPIYDGAADEGSVVSPNAPSAPHAGEAVPSSGPFQEQAQEAYDEGWHWTAEEPVTSDTPQAGETAPPAQPSQEEEPQQQQQHEGQEVYDDDNDDEGQTLTNLLLVGLVMLAITLSVAILAAVIAPSKRSAQEQQAAPEWARGVPYEEPSSILSNRQEECLPEEQDSPMISSTVPPDAVVLAHSEEDASIAAAPNPVPPEVDATTLIWSIGHRPAGQVYVSVDGGPEEFLAEGVDGYAQAVGIQPNVTYEFRLYAGAERTVPLDTVAVTRSEEALRSEASNPAARRLS